MGWIGVRLEEYRHEPIKDGPVELLGWTQVPSQTAA